MYVVVSPSVRKNQNKNQTKCKKKQDVFVKSMAFQLFNGDSSQIHVSWTIFNQCLTLSQTTYFTLFQIERVCRQQF